MSDSKFSHLVEIDENAGQVKSYRVVADGRKQFYTEAALPPHTTGPNNPAFAQFARTLGENILLDSPAARKAIGI